MHLIWKGKLGNDEYSVIQGIRFPDGPMPQALYHATVNGAGIGGFSHKRDAIKYCKSFAKTRNNS